MFSRSINDTSRVVRMTMLGAFRVIRMMIVGVTYKWAHKARVFDPGKHFPA